MLDVAVSCGACRDDPTVWPCDAIVMLKPVMRALRAVGMLITRRTVAGLPDSFHRGHMSGIVVLVIGAVLVLAGSTGHAIAGRRHHL